MAVVRKRLLIGGQVQGVFFRDSLRRQATMNGVGGYAKNLGDGRVEVVLEGAAADVNIALAWCREGPPSATVESVEVIDEEPRGLEGFDVG
jgi:acylphosphatase